MTNGTADTTDQATESDPGTRTDQPPEDVADGASGHAGRIPLPEEEEGCGVDPDD